MTLRRRGGSTPTEVPPTFVVDLVTTPHDKLAKTSDERIRALAEGIRRDDPEGLIVIYGADGFEPQCTLAMSLIIAMSDPCLCDFVDERELVGFPSHDPGKFLERIGRSQVLLGATHFVVVHEVRAISDIMGREVPESSLSRITVGPAGRRNRIQTVYMPAQSGSSMFFDPPRS